MGKKRSAKKLGSLKNGPVKLLPQARIELAEIVDQLFKRCTKVPIVNLTPAQEWEEYLQIYQLVEKIQEKEKDILLPTYDRQEQLKAFFEWLDTNSVKVEGVEIHDYGHEGFGLKCTKDLCEGDVVLVIPKSTLMSEETAKKSYLGSLILKDPILQHMGNVALSIHLLGEYVNMNSFWQPYLRILPSEFCTTLYFTPDEIQSLKGSPLLEETVKQFRNIARQYSYFYRIFQTLPEARSWPIKDYFTFDAYRWAVSAVMTRLNRIPCKDSSGQLALIPAWDMANHENGLFSTDFNETKEEITCFAQRNFVSEEQFRIYYGQRSNFEFFLHSGFVYKDNPNDNFSLKLGVSKNDPLHEDKAALLAAVDLPLNGTFFLVHGDHPIPADLLCFTRIFCMDKETIGEWKADAKSAKKLLNEDCDVGKSVEDKVNKFLHTRISLLLKAYPTTMEEDEENLPNLSGSKALIRMVLIEEKKILKDVLSYLTSAVDK